MSRYLSKFFSTLKKKKEKVSGVVGLATWFRIVRTFVESPRILMFVKSWKIAFQLRKCVFSVLRCGDFTDYYIFFYVAKRNIDENSLKMCVPRVNEFTSLSMSLYSLNYIMRKRRNRVSRISRAGAEKFL